MGYWERRREQEEHPDRFMDCPYCGTNVRCTGIRTHQRSNQCQVSQSKKRANDRGLRSTTGDYVLDPSTVLTHAELEHLRWFNGPAHVGRTGRHKVLRYGWFVAKWWKELAPAEYGYDRAERLTTEAVKAIAQHDDLREQVMVLYALMTDMGSSSKADTSRAVQACVDEWAAQQTAEREAKEAAERAAIIAAATARCEAEERAATAAREARAVKRYTVRWFSGDEATLVLCPDCCAALVHAKMVTLLASEVVDAKCSRCGKRVA